MAPPRVHNGIKRTAPFPRGSLKRAQEERGLNNDQVASELRISVSTWARWKRTDLVPIRDAAAVALLLGMPTPVDPDVPAVVWEIIRKVDDLQRRLGEIEESLRG